MHKLFSGGTYHMNLGENIYQNRTAHNLSQGDLANALNVSRQSVSKWENNSAVPELDKLIKMSKLFNITLDDLVYGQPAAPAPSQSTRSYPPVRVMAGGVILLFGMVFFLLSIFWGDHLRFSEELGELLSISIVLLSIALIATYNHKILAICAVIYFLYACVCFGILHVVSLTNYLFMTLSGIVLLVWFLILGLHANADKDKKQDNNLKQAL